MEYFDKPNVTIVGVVGEPTRNGNTRYVVQLSDGSSPSTFDVAAYNRALNLQNEQGVTVRCELKPSQDGTRKFENFIDAFPAGTEPPLLEGATKVTAPPPQQRRGGGGGRGSNWSPSDTTRVAKLSAYEIAFNFVGSIYQGAGPEVLKTAITEADELAKTIYVNARSHENQAAAAQPVASTPEQVVAEVNQAAGAAVVQQGAAPVAQEAGTNDVKWD